METTNEPGRRLLADIRDDLSKPIPDRLIETKPATGKRNARQLEYIPWHRAQRVLDHYTNGHWHYKVIDRQWTDGRFLCTVRIDIEHADGVVSREGMGIEAADVSGYGNPVHNAESQAFRRAAARFGLAINLYEKE